jgi:RNA polymerase sigma-70 factor (ECF subfamily)
VLLARLRHDDERALDALLERHWAALFGYAYRRTGSRDLAADVAQEAYCRLWERRAAWRAGGSVRGLLFRLARNAAVSQHRRQRARERAARRFAELYLEGAPPVLPAERAELRAALREALSALPARRREVFLLRVLDDLSYAEIAEVMGTSKQTVANQLSRALSALRRGLGYLLD